jgi:hypothetical protein
VRYYSALVVQGIPDAISGDYYNAVVTFSCSSVLRVLSPMARRLLPRNFGFQRGDFDMSAMSGIMNAQRRSRFVREPTPLFRPPA